MKKRKELDALVANGKVRKKANGSGSGHSSSHELLRVADTDTTDTEDFSGLQARKCDPKKTFALRRLCTACVPLCVFTLITASIVGLGTLLWLQIGLREELDLLRDHLRQVEEGNRGMPLQFHDLHTDMKQIVSNNTAIRADIIKLNFTLTTITTRLDDISKRVGLLEQKSGNQTEFGRLPEQVKAITDTVASFGSNLLDLENSVKALKSDTSGANLKASLNVVEEDVNSLKLSQSKSVTHDRLTQALQNGMVAINSTLGSRIQGALEDISEQNGRIVDLYSTIQNLTRILTLESGSPQQLALNPTSAEKINEIVQNKLNIALAKQMNSSLPLLSTNGSVNLTDIINYMKNVYNLYVAIVAKLQKVPEANVLNSSMALNFTGNIEDIVKDVISPDRLQLKNMQGDVGKLKTSVDGLKSVSESTTKKLNEMDKVLEKLVPANPLASSASTNITVAAPSSTNQQVPSVISNSTSNNGSISPTVTTDPPNLVPPKKPILTGGSLNLDSKPENSTP